MHINRIDLVKEEFARLGFWKVDEEIRTKATQVIIGEADLDSTLFKDKKGDVRDLVTLYHDINSAEFLQAGFNKLSVRDKLEWLRSIVERPESGFHKADLAMVLSGRDGFAVDALLKAYKDKNKNVHDYAVQIFEKILFAEKSNPVTYDNVRNFIDELSQMREFPQPYGITEEKLKGTATILTSFLFNLGGNIYVLSYKKNGGIVHTLIDTGESRYKPYIIKIFKDKGIEPANIERILLTHHHYDHSGLVDLWCMLSGARLLLHPDFTGEPDQLDMSRFKKYVEWLAPTKENTARNIGGMAFPVLGEPVDIGEGAKLEILGLPGGSSLTHTVDQLIFVYTPRNSPETLKKISHDFKPTDEILFSGDLWLMHPPGFSEETIGSFKIHELIKERRRNFDHRPQNRNEKDALKTGFSLITVKPGHGPEFLGSKIVGTLLAKRDILVKLGFDENASKDVLNDRKKSFSIKQLKERGYQNFIEELKLWLNPLGQGGFGYDLDAVSKFLLRIYKEQTGGGELVGQDRKERRLDLREKLSVLRTDVEQPQKLHLLAESALSMIEKTPSL